MGRLGAARRPLLDSRPCAAVVVVGAVLVAEGFGHHVPKGYIYFGMAFSLAVEMLNIRLRRNAARPVSLRPARIPGDE